MTKTSNIETALAKEGTIAATEERILIESTMVSGNVMGHVRESTGTLMAFEN